MGAAAAIPVAPTARLIKLAPGTNGALAVAQTMGPRLQAREGSEQHRHPQGRLLWRDKGESGG